MSRKNTICLTIAELVAAAAFAQEAGVKLVTLEKVVEPIAIGNVTTAYAIPEGMPNTYRGGPSKDITDYES